MLSATHTTRNSLLCALLCVVGPTVLGCSADDPGVSPKKDAGASTGGASNVGQAGSISNTTTGASGSGLAGSLGTGGAINSTGGGGNGGTPGAGGAGGQDCTTDTDGDGTPDCMDDCQFDKNKTKAGVCGCGFVDNASGDVTGDGGIDCLAGQFYEAEKGTISASDAGAATDGGASGPWTIGDDVNAAGGHYIVSPAGLNDGTVGPAHVTITMNIPADGMYVIWGRFYAPTIDNNRIWMRVDTAVWQRLRGTTGDTWHWYHFNKDGDWANPLLFTLTKGAHTLDIANDTPGNKIDRFYVTPVGAGDTPAAGPGADTTCDPPNTVKMGDMCAASCGMLAGASASCDAVVCQGKTTFPAYDCVVCCAIPAGDAAAE